MANPPEISQLDLRGLGPEELATILTGGINIGKIRADQVQAQQQAELENARNLILQQQQTAREKKDDLQFQIQLRQSELANAKLDETERHNKQSELAQMQLALAAMTRAEKPTASENPKPQAFKLSNGQYTWVTPGETIPTGAVPVSENPTDAGLSAQVDTADTLRKYHEGLVGKDKEEGQPYADVINKFDPNWSYKWGKVPGTLYGTNPGWERVPKSMQTTQPTGTAPAAAIEYLRKNPQLKEQFKLKYGYIPEGI